LKTEKWVVEEHNRTFVNWFAKKVQSQAPETISKTIHRLAKGPEARVQTYQGFDMNGFIWYTKKQDGKSTVQNSGVTLVALSGDANSSDSYYGWIEEIWELDYYYFKVPIFLCKWIEYRRGVKNDEDRFITVDFNRLAYQDDPFILAQHAQQVFYVIDLANKKLHVVLPGKRHIVGVENLVDEEDYFDDVPPFSTGINTEPVQKSIERIYLRSDHQEGSYIKKQKAKKKN
jgi:Domain of unknown function (DUF4216)